MAEKMKTGLIKFGNILGIFFVLLYLWIFYRVIYKEETITDIGYDSLTNEEMTETYKEGRYYMRKRIWVFLLLSPLIFPVFVLYLIPLYINWIISYPSIGVQLKEPSEAPNFQTRLSIRYHIFSNH